MQLDVNKIYTPNELYWRKKIFRLHPRNIASRSKISQRNISETILVWLEKFRKPGKLRSSDSGNYGPNWKSYGLIREN